MVLPNEPVPQGTEDLTRDGSLLKTVLVEGEGDEAGRGARVAVRYSLRLSDEEGAEPFDSSAKRRDGILEFTLGRKKVIPALELVAQSMKQGEKCTARAAAPYAFGTRGLKRKGVPPNVPIFIDVEMVRFEGGEKQKVMADMTPAERFEEAKVCKETGNTFFKEQKYDKALTQYSQSIRYLSNVFYKPSATLADPVATPVGGATAEATRTTEEVPENETNGSAMEEGFETAEIVDNDQNVNELPPEGKTSAQYNEDSLKHGPPAKVEEPVPQDAEAAQQQGNVALAGNETGTQNDASLPPVDKTATVDDDGIETIDVSTGREEAKGEQISGREAVESVITEEEKGIESVSEPLGAASAGATVVTELLKQQDKGEKDGQERAENSVSEGRDNASEPAEKSVGVVSAESKEQPIGSDDPEETEVRALHVTTLNNLSLCFVKLEDYKRAVESASLALKIDPQNSKALYYRGRAEIALGEWEVARADLVAAAKIQPKNPGIRNEITKLDRKIKQFEEREKKQAAAMFA